MKKIKSVILKSIKLVIIMTLICGVIYPLALTGISQLFFRDKANGSIIEVNGVKYGSELLGQQFTGNEYLWGRIMNINTSSFKDTKGNPVMYSGPSNLSPAGDQYKKLAAERVAKLKQAYPYDGSDKIPADLVTCSGSGMDPHISVAAAYYQIPRIAKSRNMTEAQVKGIIDKYTTDRLLGIFGEKVVNVLKVNLTMDGILK